MTHYQLIVIISIDRRFAEEEVKRIEVSIRSDKKDVKAFLQELKAVLESEGFDIDRNFIFIKTKKSKAEFSTPYLLADLDYDAADVVERLKELTVEEYSETLSDKDDDKPPLLFVFGKDINNRQVYIKIKIKGKTEGKVLCLSFHYAEWKMSFTYAV